MVAFSSGNPVEFGSLFNVAYHIDFISLIEAAWTQQMSKEEALTHTDQVFEHPSSIDLSIPFNMLRNLGGPLAPSDKQSIQELTQECKYDIESLGVKISETISMIGQLCRSLSDGSCRFAQRKNQIQLCNHLLSATTAPIQLLPQEILEEIFLTCFYGPGARAAKINAPEHIPSSLAAVCYKWRTIALGIPELWKYISFNTSSPGSLDRAKGYLQRCRFPALSLEIQTPSPEFNQLLTLLKAPSIHIRALDIVSTSEDETSRALPVLGCNLDELEEIVVRSEHFHVSDLPIPHLKRLFIHQVPAS
ncbi:hypothetical protein BDN72DRAFT_848714 [Pluteus cervinus]|uniref:Uncharacterized protein n=1 Tax=Pluteus cervinus TaxID=181527 RepID=A0ACD3A978_9AGAR|nr:hypothetical protein BDN72DRAFT_848714 [Pluteus cervinus]